MKFRPILFNTEMVKAILEGRKTQTRRVVKPNPIDMFIKIWNEGLYQERYPDYTPLNLKGLVGDILWVRETFYVSAIDGSYQFKADRNHTHGLTWKPSIFMPKSACRIFLEITDIRIERLRDITEDDAISEGIKEIHPVPFDVWYKNYLKENILYWRNPEDSFRTLWQSINGLESWYDNPFVWVIKFKRVDKPINFK